MTGGTGGLLSWTQMMRITWLTRLTRPLVLASVLGSAGMGEACSKDQEPATVDLPSASAVGTALASPPTGADAGAGAGADAGARAAPGASATPLRCGDKPLPPCPLNAWMKANTAAAMSAQDLDELVVALDKVAGFAPAGYANWASIARDGANAARAQSLDGVKASCRGCHNQYKDRYKREMRDRPI
jgi:hypothetical protein